MICKAENCTNFKRLRMGYCDGHYQRLYLTKDLKEYRPVKIYCKRGAGIKLLKELADGKSKMCVIWPFGKDSRGYGQVYYKGRHIKAHRLARMFLDGLEDNPPPEVFACHTCDIRDCINPNHVYWGTAKTNFDDKELFRL